MLHSDSGSKGRGCENTRLYFFRFMLLVLDPMLAQSGVEILCLLSVCFVVAVGLILQYDMFGAVLLADLTEF